MERCQDSLNALRKSRVELEAEATADNTRRREKQPRAAEEHAAEVAAQAAVAEAAAAELTTTRPCRKQGFCSGPCQRGAEGRAAVQGVPAGSGAAPQTCAQQHLAAGLSASDPLNTILPLLLKSRNLPITATGNAKAKAHWNHG